MPERKKISPKLRFEVFKRDSFRCQYCGRSSPEVILEVDHIQPVSEGGENVLVNLVTSCRDCNRGKGKRLISDDQAVIKQKAELDALNERRLQMEMMIRWKTELEEICEKQIDAISNIILDDPEKYILSNRARNEIKKLIKRFDFPIVYESCEIASVAYSSIQERFQKLGGICYNLKKKGEGRGY